jgi:hypothetical protein
VSPKYGNFLKHMNHGLLGDIFSVAQCCIVVQSVFRLSRLLSATIFLSYWLGTLFSHQVADSGHCLVDCEVLVVSQNLVLVSSVGKILLSIFPVICGLVVARSEIHRCPNSFNFFVHKFPFLLSKVGGLSSWAQISAIHLAA